MTIFIDLRALNSKQNSRTTWKECVQVKLKSIDYYCQKRFTERERQIEKMKARERGGGGGTV